MSVTRDRIGRGPPQWFDHAMALGPQRRQRLVGKAVLDPYLVRQPLMVQARRGHRGRDSHAVIERIDDHLHDRRDDAAAAGANR